MELNQVIENFSVNTLKSFFLVKLSTFKPVNENYEYIFTDNDYITENYKTIEKIGEADLTNSDDLLVIAAQTIEPLTNRTGKKRQYEIAKKILKEENKDAAIFVFYDEQGNFRFSLITAQYSGTKREFTTYKRYTYFVSSEYTNKTFRLQIGKADFSSVENILKAFSIDAVTDEFYKEFKPNFEELTRSIIGKAEQNIKQDFALLFIIRIIFLGFVQKKGWLNKNKEFIQDYWKEYKSKYAGKNLFYDEWLKPLFFQALNSPPGRKIFNRSTPFSKETALALQMAPYLNGELFKEKKGYDDLDLTIPDDSVEAFFDFLFSYNFTIEENTLYDQELELNPEFLGIIFERLVNKEDGAVYTPRTEVDFMCRISLVNWIQKNSAINKKKIYHLFFDSDTENYIANNFTEEEKENLTKLLQSVTVCDPAAGSGAFPVGMMQVLFETLNILAPNEQTEFERKKEIISRSLYGVEVKHWAVWINQLRLWLSLFIEMPDELKNSFEPLLPNLEFKIRQGDSLVQIVGNKIFPIGSHADISSNIKKQITGLKKEKANFFYGKSKLKAKQIRQKESNIFKAIIDEQITEKKRSLKLFGQSNEGDVNIFGEVDAKEELRLQMDEKKKQQLIDEITELREERNSFRDEHPLVWNIEFAEIFYEKNGFDIIIGNPPYVRQEDIKDPENKLEPKEYKEALRQSIYEEFPDYFYSSKQKTKLRYKIDGKSDLYTFFYLKSLKLLNGKGIHTFICSNSWLDVGFGKWLQEFILEKVPVKFIIDNQAKRSFASADVNTIISVFEAPQNSIGENFKTKFIAFKKPFENVINTENLLLLDYAETIVKDEDFRVFPITYKELKEAGTVYENENDKKLGKGKYEGDKWGGKYLRAPDIYWTIMEKGKGKFVRLGDIAEVRRGFTTGANDFFYIEDLTGKITELDFNRIENLKNIKSVEEIKEKNLRVVKPSKYKSGDKDYKLFLIEDEFLKPVIKNPRESNEIILIRESLKYLVFMCNFSKTKLSNSFAALYISWGEQKKEWKDEKRGKYIPVNERPTCKSRKLWWNVGEWKPADAFWMESINDINRVYLNTLKIFESDKFYGITFDDKENNYNYSIILNSTIYALFRELKGFHGMGEGVLKLPVYDVKRIEFLIIENIEPKKITRELSSIFTELGFDPTKPIPDQEPNPLSDRKELDDIIFDALGLTEEERKEVYWATAELVQNRLNKAKSV